MKTYETAGDSNSVDLETPVGSSKAKRGGP
jgi:hypothetical protein